MNWLTAEQTKGQIRTALAFVAGILVMFGYLHSNQAADFVNNLNAVVVSVGTAVGAASAAWSAISKTRNAIIAQAAALPEVSKVVVSTPAIVAAMPASAEGTVISAKTENASKS